MFAEAPKALNELDVSMSVVRLVGMVVLPCERVWRRPGVGMVAVSASGCDLYMYMSRAVGGCLGAVGVGLSHACVVREEYM